MTRSNTFSVSRGRSFLLALVLASGCAHSTTDLRDSLAQRIKPVDADAGQADEPTSSQVQRLGHLRTKRCGRPLPHNPPSDCGQ